MFKSLFDFSYKRNFIEAVGFYIAYFVFAVILAFCAGLVGGGIARIITQGDPIAGRELGGLIGGIFGFVSEVLLCLIVSIIIAVKKKLKDFWSILLIILSFIFTTLAGGFFTGLIPCAILSAKKSQNN